MSQKRPNSPKTISNARMDELEKGLINEGIGVVCSQDGRIWPLPALNVPRSVISADLQEGDIVTLGQDGNPERDRRTGIPIPPKQRFVIRVKEGL